MGLQSTGCFAIDIKRITVKYPNICKRCGAYMPRGVQALWDQETNVLYHPWCKERAPQPKKDNRYIIYHPDSDAFFLLFEYNKELVSAVKRIPGVQWDDDGKLWKVRNVTLESARILLDVADHYGFTYGTPELDRLQSSIQEGAANLLLSMASKSTFEVKGLKKSPYPFQRAGIEIGVTQKRVIIADEQGLGKTIQAMGIVAHLQLFPALIVCPSVLKLNWKKEILDWIDGIKDEDIKILSGRKPENLGESRIWIINYDILQARWRELSAESPRFIVFDEAHYIKNASSQRGKAAREISKECEYVLGLTGTPILSRPEEIINPLRVIRRIDELGGVKFFEVRYCAGHMDNFGRWNTHGASNLKELNDRLRSTGIYVRRNKRDVLTDLPAKQRRPVYLEINNRSEYDKAEKDVAKWLADQAVADREFKDSIASLSPLDQLYATRKYHQSVEYRNRKIEQLRRFDVLKRLASRGKFQGVLDWTDNFLDTGEKLVEFAWFIETQNRLLERYPSAVHIIGEDSENDRENAVNRFQTDPAAALFVGSIKAAGVGITLTASSNLAFLEVGWTPADQDQAEDRIHRIGQQGSVNIYYLTAVGTIEEELIDIIDIKRNIVSHATEGVGAEESGVLNALVSRLIKKHHITSE